LTDLLAHVRFWANIEKALIVVSDMADGKSHIIDGGFARNLDIGDYQHENSICESRILSLMSEDGLGEKYIAEQEIIGKLQVKNTHEACRIAKSLNTI
jgi:hypothetical protein